MTTAQTLLWSRLAALAKSSMPKWVNPQFERTRLFRRCRQSLIDETPAFPTSFSEMLSTSSCKKIHGIFKIGRIFKENIASNLTSYPSAFPNTNAKFKILRRYVKSFWLQPECTFATLLFLTIRNVKETRQSIAFKLHLLFQCFKMFWFQNKLIALLCFFISN